MKFCLTTKNATKLKVFVASSFLRYKNLQKLHKYTYIVRGKKSRGANIDAKTYSI